MTETVLEPCPFCGGKAKLTDLTQAPESWVECTECGARTRFFSNSNEAPVSAWNNRPIEDKMLETFEETVVKVGRYIDAINRFFDSQTKAAEEVLEAQKEFYSIQEGEE